MFFLTLQNRTIICLEGSKHYKLTTVSIYWNEQYEIDYWTIQQDQDGAATTIEPCVRS